MSSRVFTLVFLILSSVIFSRPPFSHERTEELLKQFKYKSTYKLLKNPKAARGMCMHSSIKFETTYPEIAPKKLIVIVDTYIPRDRKFAPTIIQLPPISGANFLDRKMASTFCSNNIAVFQIKNDFTGFDGKNSPAPEEQDNAFRMAISAIKASREIAIHEKKLDANKIGIFGVSLGGILGSYAMGALDEVSAGYFLVIGGDLPYILAHSKQKRVAKLRRIRMKEENLKTEDEYESWLQKYTTFDPQDITFKIPKDAINLVIANYDTSVHTEKQKELHKALKEPETTYYNSGHINAVFKHLFWNSTRTKIAKTMYQKLRPNKIPNLQLVSSLQR